MTHDCPACGESAIRGECPACGYAPKPQRRTLRGQGARFEGEGRPRQDRRKVKNAAGAIVGGNGSKDRRTAGYETEHRR